MSEPRVRLNRRRLIGLGAVAGTALLGGGYALVERGVLPGQSALDRALGRCDVPPPAGDAAPGPAVTGTFDSARRRRPVGYLISYPPGVQPGARLPVCLVLHGYASTGTDAVISGAYDRYLAGLVAAGGRPFALAAMDGGDGYWHPHAEDDPLGALLDEFVPVLGSRGLRTDRIGVLGWSMGGYGALLCALTAPDRIAAVAAGAPAFWRSYEEARRVNPGAFDSAEEWQRHDVLARAAQLGAVPLRIDCGADDSFAPAVRELQGRLRDPSVVHIAKGCHDTSFRRSVAPAQLRFIGAALS